MLRRIIHGALSLLGDSIEAVGSGEYREDLHARLKKCAERGAELALENSRLRDQVDRLRFNGPSLWRDEVDSIRHMIATCPYGNVAPAEELLRRCDHLPMTREELDEQCQGVLDGTADITEWTADDDRGTCAVCHDDPRPVPAGEGCPECGNHGRELTGESW